MKMQVVAFTFAALRRYASTTEPAPSPSCHDDTPTHMPRAGERRSACTGLSDRCAKRLFASVSTSTAENAGWDTWSRMRATSVMRKTSAAESTGGAKQVNGGGMNPGFHG